VFVFQAEDGIRDFHVTGVQTCALPISTLSILSGSITYVLTFFLSSSPATLIAAISASLLPFFVTIITLRMLGTNIMTARLYQKKIGRASCRETVEVEGAVGVSGRDKCG